MAVRPFSWLIHIHALIVFIYTMSSEWHDGAVTNNVASRQEGPRFDLDSGLYVWNLQDKWISGSKMSVGVNVSALVALWWTCSLSRLYSAFTLKSLRKEPDTPQPRVQDKGWQKNGFQSWLSPLSASSCAFVWLHNIHVAPCFSLPLLRYSVCIALTFKKKKKQQVLLGSQMRPLFTSEPQFACLVSGWVWKTFP